MLSEADLKTIDHLGLKDLVDLRTSEARVMASTRIQHVRYSAVGYTLDEMTPNPAGGQNMA